MAKAKKKKSYRLWVILPLIIVVFLTIYSLSKNNLPLSQQSSTNYLIYRDSMYGFSIKYPQAWVIRKDTHIFENGDAIAFGKTGLTQKQNTELTDGAQVVISKPFNIDTDITLWTKKHFDNQAVFSKNTTTGHTFEQVYTCSNFGCMTFLFTLVHDQVYGVAIFKEGPDKDKMIYENATLYMLKSLKFADIKIKSISKKMATTKVTELSEVIEYLKRVPRGLVAVNGEADNTYIVQVYEIKDGHTATFNWYEVNKTTGIVTKQN